LRISSGKPLDGTGTDINSDKKQKSGPNSSITGKANNSGGKSGAGPGGKSGGRSGYHYDNSDDGLDNINDGEENPYDLATSSSEDEVVHNNNLLGQANPYKAANKKSTEPSNVMTTCHQQ